MNSIDNLLAPYARFGVDLTLQRVIYLLEKLGKPQNTVPIIHVAGTNGKGSVCAFLSTILVTAGYRTGRYISPHLVDWCERISINNLPIKPEDLQEAIQVVQTVIEPHCMPTQFEVLTCAMWWYFAQQQIDIAVIETGLGGRLDATNVCELPLVAVITSIS
ncbi:MAG: bifunctional folylpolyglutamate synthase/dihydrofolate synthase, partial [Pseudanabaenaceae cyanobacterium]